MKQFQLSDEDVRAFITAFNSIAEIDHYDFDEDTEYRLAIANLVGDFKSQVCPSLHGVVSVVPRIDLTVVFVEKYVAWDRDCLGGSACLSADRLISVKLDKSGYDSQLFAGEGNAEDSIRRLRDLVNRQADGVWSRFELALCSSARADIDNLLLPDLLDGLFRWSADRF